jgi:dipeptidyl aminopeptidase/acylaminoacyl peptidase
MFRVIGALCALLCFTAFGAAAQQARPPASAFGRMPAIQSVVISPDGQKLAILGGSPTRRVISITPIDSSASARVDLGKVDVSSIRWGGNGYVIVRTSQYETGRGANNGTFAYHFQRNVVIDTNGKVLNQLLVDNSYSQFTTYQPILGIIDGKKPVAIVQGRDIDGAALQSRVSRIEGPQSTLVATLFKVDLATGKGSILERGGQTTAGWEVDSAGEPRVRWDIDTNLRQMSVFGRAKGERRWKLIDRAPYEETREQVVVGYSEPDDAVIMLKSAPEGVKVVRRALADGAETVLGPQINSQSPHVTWDLERNMPIGIVVEEERPAYQWLDAEMGAVHAKLARVFKGKLVTLMGWSSDRSRFVVRIDASDSVPQWMLFEAATNQLSPIGDEYPELAEVRLGATRWLTYKARDGLEINAYLTLPPGLAAGVKPPLVVMPHGGPASRDSYGFDWWVQFLASRGYAVLQPQFRGSSGFGDSFERAGEREWGGKMQTDLLDGVDHLAKDGVIDSARVCIVGASYGGYAALAGATLHPDAWRCAASINGISDLTLMILDETRSSNEATQQYWRRVAGDSRVTPGFLVSISPAKLADRAKAPILLIHGEEDTVVNINQSRVMFNALQAARRPVEFVTLEGDDHFLSGSEPRTKMLETLEVFLARNLPVAP